MQDILVILTFSLAAGFLVKKFVWNQFLRGDKRRAQPWMGKTPNVVKMIVLATKLI